MSHVLCVMQEYCPLKPVEYNACFPARLLAGLESCHWMDIGCDTVSANRQFLSYDLF